MVKIHQPRIGATAALLDEQRDIRAQIAVMVAKDAAPSQQIVHERAKDESQENEIRELQLLCHTHWPKYLSEPSELQIFGGCVFPGLLYCAAACCKFWALIQRELSDEWGTARHPNSAARNRPGTL